MSRYVLRPRRSMLLAGAALLGGLLTSAGPAPAAFPGANGRIAFTSGDSDIYVMNPDGHNATRLTTHAAIDSRPDWSPDGTRLAFSSWRDGKPEIYAMNADGSNQTRLTDSPGSDDPAWSPDGTKLAFMSFRDGIAAIYVMNADGSNQIRLANNTAPETQPAWSPDGSRLAFIRWHDRNAEIYVMNADGSNQTRLTNDPALDTDAAWSPDGTKLAFTSGRDGTSGIYVMNADGSDPTRLAVDTTSDDPAWSPDGTKVAFTSFRDGGPEIYVMHADGSSPMRLSNRPGGNADPAWQRLLAQVDLTRPVLTLEGSNPLLLEAGSQFAEPGASAVDDVDGDLSRAILITGTVDAAMPGIYTITYAVSDAAGNTATATRAVLVIQTVTPGANGKIAFTSSRDGNADIYVMDADGSNQTRLTNHPASDSDAAWSPDGTKLAFSSGRDGIPEIYVMNADGSDPTRLTTNTDYDTQPDWSPDGSRLAFTGWRGIYADIVVMNADGSGQTRVATEPTVNQSPAWSPDGTKIAFAHDIGEIRVMNADGSNQTRLNALAFGAAWSPDGWKLAFTSVRDGNYDVYSMTAGAGDQTRLTVDPALDTAPAWSPDGTKLAFTSERDGNGEIYVMGADGSGQRRLTDDPASDSDPAWQPIARNSCGEVRGDGRLDTNTLTRFVFSAVKSDGTSAPSGEISFTDRATSPRLHFESISITTFVITGKHVRLAGSGVANGVPVEFVVEGDDGSRDRFSIRLSNGYAAAGAVAAGRGVNIKPCDSGR